MHGLRGISATAARAAVLTALWLWLTRPVPGPAPDDMSGTAAFLGALVVVALPWGFLDGLLPRRADHAVTFARALGVWSGATLVTALLVPTLSPATGGRWPRPPSPDEVALAFTVCLFAVLVPAALGAAAGVGSRSLVRTAGRRRGSRRPSVP